MNITTYNMDEEAHLLAWDALVLEPRRTLARDLTDLELHHFGFDEEPAWQDGENLHVDVVHTERVLPSEVVRLKTEAALRAWRAAHDDGEPAGDARKAIKESVRANLIREAPQRTTRIPVVLHAQGGLVLIGTAKSGEAEAVLTLLRHELGSFPALPLDNSFARLHLTAAVSALRPAVPGPFELGSKVALERDGGQHKARFSGADMGGEDVQECLRSGSLVTQLGLFDGDGVIQFELDHNLVLRRFTVTDVAEDRMDEEIDRWGDSNKALRVIRFGEAVKVLAKVLAWMEVSQPLAQERKAA